MKGQFEADATSPLYREWFSESVEAFDFYEGRQWKQEDLDALAKLGISPTTVNKVQARLDNVAGQEVQTRTKIVYRARSLDDKEKATAEAASDLAMFIEDTNQSTHKLSKVADDARKCGVGWHEFDVQDGVILEAARNPLEVVPDFTDRTPGMTNQRRLSTMTWMPKDEVKARFPDKKDEIDGASNWAMSAVPAEIASLADRLRFTACKGYLDKDTQEILVVEHFWREPATYYEVITRSNRLVTTFDRREAEDLAGGVRLAEKNVTKRHGYKVFLAYFTGDVLLEYNEEFYQLNPAKGLFLLRPIICKRERVSGKPYGLLRSAMEPQRNYNKTRTRLRWQQASNQVIMEGDASDGDKVRSEAARPDGVLLVKAGRKLEINRHEQAIAQSLQVLQQDGFDIQDAMGIYDENMGRETNAKSGVAIQRRQVGGDRNTAMIMDNVRAMKVEWGRTLLLLIQAVFTEQIAFWVLDDEGEMKSLSLNEPEVDQTTGKPVKDKDGNPVLKNDIRTVNFSVYVEEVPDVATQVDVARGQLIDLAQASGGLQNITPGMAELYGVPKSSKLMQELQNGVPGQQVAQNAALQNSVGGMVPTKTPPQGAPTTA